MSYALERISAEGKRRFDADAGPQLARILDKRHFWESEGHEFDHYWAVDSESGNYLMLSPKFLQPYPGNLYFFSYQSKLYRFRIKGSYDPMVDFYTGERPPSELYEDFKSELTRAFAVHGEDGTLDTRALAPTFPEKV